jgi:cell division protein FtsZ
MHVSERRPLSERVESLSGARDDLGPPQDGEPALEVRVIGIGGGGCNAVHRYFPHAQDLGQVWAFNTDAQHLLTVQAHHKVLLGRNLCRGRGANADPHIGQMAAEESRPQLAERLAGARLVFLLAGLGGGTGSGAAPVVAKVAREQKATTVAFVTHPFSVEGNVRSENAKRALEHLRAHTDFTSVFRNDRLLSEHPGLSLRDALRKADEELFRPIRALHRAARQSDLTRVRARLRRAAASSAGSATATRQSGYAQAAARAVAAAAQGLAQPAASAIVVAGTAGDLAPHERAAILEVTLEAMGPEGTALWGYFHDPALAGSCEVSVFLACPADPPR